MWKSDCMKDNSILTMDQVGASLELKRIHSMLRRDVRNEGNADMIWQDHKTNKTDLQRYSKAMVSLANIWEDSQPLHENRVEWCMMICREYFWHGGLNNQLEKELRKMYYDSLKTSELPSTKSLECFLEENQQYTNVKEFFCNRKLKFLDVGSCYNPFRKFGDEIVVLPMDLYPATDEVFQGDFLELEIIEKVENGTANNQSCMKEEIALLQRDYGLGEIKTAIKDTVENSRCTRGFLSSIQTQTIHPCRKENDLNSTERNNQSVDICKEYLENPLRKLPRESFDVLVFSLVLSYLPTQKQRWDCCVKANRLLHENGLLILIESDSAHQHRNAHQIRAWKQALQGIGFVRYNYKKLTHLHCMAFRKKTDVDDLINQSKFIDNSSLMFIPQDSHDNMDESEEEIVSIRTDEENKEMSDVFNLLPESI